MNQSETCVTPPPQQELHSLNTAVATPQTGLVELSPSKDSISAGVLLGYCVCTAETTHSPHISILQLLFIYLFQYPVS